MAGHIEDATCKYAETLELPSTDLDKLIKSRFKHAIPHPETNNQLLWDDTDMTLDYMIQKVQQLEDFCGMKQLSPKSPSGGQTLVAD